MYEATFEHKFKEGDTVLWNETHKQAIFHHSADCGPYVIRSVGITTEGKVEYSLTDSGALSGLISEIGVPEEELKPFRTFFGWDEAKRRLKAGRGVRIPSTRTALVADEDQNGDLLLNERLRLSDFESDQWEDLGQFR